MQKKLQKPWEGPLVVMKCLGGSVYRLSDKKKAQVLHHDRLKPYNSEFIPQWARKLSKQARNQVESEIQNQ